jgi:hypothetical protein
MDGRKLLDRNMVASFNGGGHRWDYLASRDHFLWIGVPLVILVIPVFNLLQYVIGLFPLEHLIPIDSLHSLFHFLAGFAGSSEVTDKVVHSCYVAPRRGWGGLDLRHLNQLIPGTNKVGDIIIRHNNKSYVK